MTSPPRNTTRGKVGAATPKVRATTKTPARSRPALLDPSAHPKSTSATSPVETPVHKQRADAVLGARPDVQSLTSLLDGSRLSPKHQRIAQLLESSPKTAAFGAANEVAAKVAVSTATVVRFAQSLGFRGWPDLQASLRHEYLRSLMPSEMMSARAMGPGQETFQSALRSDIDNLHAALVSVDPAEVEAIARLIARSRETVVVSSGSYSASGLVLAHLAQVMGFRVRLETRGGPELMAALGLLDERDCVIGISFWRVARTVTLALASAQRHGIPTVGVADSIVSPVMQGVEHKLVVPTDSVSFFQSVTASVSVIYGLLATLQRIGGTNAEAGVRHAEDLYEDLEILHSVTQGESQGSRVDLSPSRHHGTR